MQSTEYLNSQGFFTYSLIAVLGIPINLFNYSIV